VLLSRASTKQLTYSHKAVLLRKLKKILKMVFYFYQNILNLVQCSSSVEHYNIVVKKLKLVSWVDL